MMIDDGVLATCPQYVLAARPCRLFDNLFEGIIKMLRIKTVSPLEPLIAPDTSTLQQLYLTRSAFVIRCRLAARLRLAVVTLVKVVKRQLSGDRHISVGNVVSVGIAT